jgi:hypothetical protein
MGRSTAEHTECLAIDWHRRSKGIYLVCGNFFRRLSRLVVDSRLGVEARMRAGSCAASKLTRKANAADLLI